MINKKEVILDIILLISDFEYQKRVWISQEPIHFAFDADETINVLADYGFFEDIENNTFCFDCKDHFFFLQEFGDTLVEFNQPIPLSDIFDDSNWIIISNQAKILYDIFKGQ